jgi:hypothetical protein
MLAFHAGFYPWKKCDTCPVKRLGFIFSQSFLKAKLGRWFNILGKHNLALTAGYARRDYDRASTLFDKARSDNEVSPFAVGLNYTF